MSYRGRLLSKPSSWWNDNVSREPEPIEIRVAFYQSPYKKTSNFKFCLDRIFQSRVHPIFLHLFKWTQFFNVRVFSALFKNKNIRFFSSSLKYHVDDAFQLVFSCLCKGVDNKQIIFQVPFHQQSLLNHIWLYFPPPPVKDCACQCSYRLLLPVASWYWAALLVAIE